MSRTKGAFQMKQKTFSMVFEGLSFGEKYKIDEKQHTQALKSFTGNFCDTV